MLSFLKAHISDACFLVSFVILVINNIIQLVQRSRSEKLGQIFLRIPEIISQYECLFPVGCGDLKRSFVLKEVERLCNAARVPFNKLEVTEQIEKVLSAPQKK